MAPSSVLDLKAFVPAKDYRQAKQFYVDLGFKLNWDNPETAELQIGSFRFLLQNYYVQPYAENFVMPF
jgi:catechol 2,3-dioxygenase-like lactoylglutathione lyase family enzyme